MNHRMLKSAIAAAVLVAVWLGVYYLGGSIDGASVAWADVLKNLEAARAYMYTRTFESGDAKDVMVVRVMEPYLCRHDYVEGGSGSEVGIMNTQTGKQINLHARTKSASISDEKDYAGRQFHEYGDLKKDLRDGTEKDLRRLKLNGRDTVCFEIAKSDQIITVWTDPHTALPVQIETRSNENGRTRTLMSDIRFDVGEDVKLGDASKAVCWWKPPGSSTYRVVYGDLSVRGVAPDDLPPIPWLAEQKCAVPSRPGCLQPCLSS